MKSTVCEFSSLQNEMYAMVMTSKNILHPNILNSPILTMEPNKEANLFHIPHRWINI